MCIRDRDIKHTSKESDNLSLINDPLYTNIIQRLDLQSLSNLGRTNKKYLDILPSNRFNKYKIKEYITSLYPKLDFYYWRQIVIPFYTKEVDQTYKLTYYSRYDDTKLPIILEDSSIRVFYDDYSNIASKIRNLLKGKKDVYLTQYYQSSEFDHKFDINELIEVISEISKLLPEDYLIIDSSMDFFYSSYLNIRDSKTYNSTSKQYYVDYNIDLSRDDKLRFIDYIWKMDNEDFDKYITFMQKLSSTLSIIDEELINFITDTRKNLNLLLRPYLYDELKIEGLYKILFS